MNICEEFLNSFRENSLSGWKAELASTFADFKSEKLYGNSYDFGDFDMCINFGLDKNEGFQGQYCSVQYYSTSQDTIPVMPKSSFFNQGWQNLDKRFGGAVCIPSICNSSSLVPQLMDVILNGSKYVMSSDYNQDEFCQVKKYFLMTASGAFGISFVLFFVILAIVSTFKSCRNQESIYSSFSLTRNLKNLFYDENNDDTIAYLRGIKTISHYVTAFVHMILASLYIPTKNSQNILAYHQGEYEMVISQGPAGAVFCQLITSFLLTRALWKMLELKRLNVKNIPMLYIYRYLRLVPLLFFVMVVERFIMQGWVSELIEAPYFFPNQFPRIFKFFWLPLLQIQNYFVDLRETFMPPSYYFAVDFHLFMITPFVVFLLWKWRWSCYIVFSSLIVIAYAIIYSYIIGNKEYFQNMKYLSYEERTLSRYIQETQFGLPGWIFGMIFAYFTITVKTINIDKNKKLFIWPVPFLLTFISLLRVKVPFLKEYVVYLMTFDKFYHSVIFTIILFLCHYGSQDIVTKIVSLRFWVPFDRLGLSVLIAHAMVFRWMLITRKEPLDYNLYTISEHYLYGMTASLAYGLILNLLIEQPIINLFKFFFRASSQKKKNL